VVRCEEEDEIMGNTWREVKAITGNKVYGYCFVEALCGEVE
jgi:hypothetical protein